MGAVQVLYTLSTGGDLKSALPGLASGLDKVRDEAVKAKNAVADMGTKGREAINSFGEGIGEKAENMMAFGEMVKGAVEAVNGLLEANDDYARSVAGLSSEFAKLKEGVADAIGPSVGKFIDAFTLGLVYLGNLIPDVLGTAFGFVQDGLKDLVIFVQEVVHQLGYIWEAFKSGTEINFDQVLMDLQGANALLVIDFQTAVDDMAKAQADALEAARQAWLSQSKIPTSPGGSSTAALAATGSSIDEQRANMMLGHSPSNAPDAAAAETTAAVEELTTAVKGQGLENAQALAGAVTGGLSSIMSAFAGGPVTALIEGILQILQDPTILQGLFENVLDIYTNLDTMILGVLEGVLPEIIEAIPDLIAGFATIGPAVAVALVEAAPEILASLILAIVELPIAFALAIADLFGGAIEAIVGLAKAFGGDGILGTNLGADADTKRILGVKVPFLDGGGTITRDGLAYVHKGERVVPAGSSYNSSIGAINLYGVNDMRRFAEELQSKLGGYGLNLSLTPHAS